MCQQLACPVCPAKLDGVDAHRVHIVSHMNYDVPDLVEAAEFATELFAGIPGVELLIEALAKVRHSSEKKY